MQMFRKRQVLKAMFNNFDVTKTAQTNLELRFYRKTTLKAHFKIWWNKTHKLLKQKAERLLIKHYWAKQQLLQVFKPWLDLTRRRLEQKQAFFRTRAITINRVAFDALKLNVKFTNKRRTKAKRILHHRAMRLLATSFAGFAAQRKDKQRMRKLNKAAGFYFMSLYQKKGLQSFKRCVQLRKLKDRVTSEHCWLVANDYLHQWRNTM